MIVTGWISSAVFASLAFAGSVKAEVIDLGAGQTSARLITGVLDFGKPLPQRENGQVTPQAEISLASFQPSRRAVHGTAETEELVLSVGSEYLRNPGLRAAGLSGTEWLALFRANIAVESGFNSEARSPVGAIGLGQLMPGSAAIAAVDAGDSNALMLVMKEMQRRQLVFFAAVDRAGCEEVIPLPSSITDWKFSGTARQAYINSAKKRRLAEGSCACLFKGYSFADFTMETLGKAPDALIDGDRPALQAIRDERRRETESSYRDYELKICGAN